MSSVVVFLADGFEEIEALSPVDYLRRANVEVYTVAVPSETMNDKYIVMGAHKIPVIADLSIEEFEQNFKSELPDMVFCPGGMPGATNLAASAIVTDFIARCYENGKYVTAICASPAVVLAKTGVLKGKCWTCYPGMETGVAEYCGSMDVANAALGGSTHKRDVPFVTDGTVITGRGPGAAEQFAMELVRLLCGDAVSAKIKAASVQR